MRQLIAMLLIAMLAIGFFPSAALADEHETITDDNSTDDDTDTSDDDSTENEESEEEQETEDDVEDMQTGLGAEMRLTQLEKQLVRAQTHAQEIIARIAEQNSTANLSGLEAIEAEFDVMIVEVQNARDAVVETGNTDDAVKVFVALVHDARDLTKRFREEARTRIKTEDRDALKQRLERVERERLTELEERVKEKRREYNAEQTRRVLERTGGTIDEETLSRIRSGDIDANEIRERVKTRVRELKPEEREEAVARLRDEAARARVASLARLERAQQALTDVDARYEERIRLAEERGLVEVRERPEMNRERFGEVRTRMETREDGIRTRMETRERIRSDGRVETRERTQIEKDSDDDGENDSEESESDMNDDDEGRG